MPFSHTKKEDSGADVGAQSKAAPATQDPMWSPVQDSAALLIQLLHNVPGKHCKEGASAWDPAPTQDIWKKLLALGFSSTQLQLL